MLTPENQPVFLLAISFVHSKKSMQNQRFHMLILTIDASAILAMN